MQGPTHPHPSPIIIKKKVVHAGHHGGAWKVAYADFVTALMALFIVLWLVNSSEQVRKAVGGYFLDPSGKNKDVGSGLVGSGEDMRLAPKDLKELKEKIEQSMRKAPEFQKLQNHISVTVTGEGLRIEFLETDKGIFFERGNAKPTSVGADFIGRLSNELGKLPNNLLIEGHTDARPFASDGSYTNWELSADRANAARHVMQAHGVRLDQISQVRGFADQRLRNFRNPEDASNRRISIIIQYQRLPSATPPEMNPETPRIKTPGSVAQPIASGEPKTTSRSGLLAQSKHP